MKKRMFLCRFIACLLTVLSVAVPVNASSATVDISVSSGCHTIDAQVPLLIDSEELTNVQAAFLYDYTNETVLYSLNPDEKQYPASLVKIMTGLIIAERADMNEKITVTDKALSQVPENSIGIDLQVGETITMQSLLYCIMVESANDAAVVAADHVCGSTEAFVEQMNQYAQELGCTNTNFTNVHGLHDINQFSTARDLARILSAAATNEVFMDAFATVNYTVPATNMAQPRLLSSNNHLMNDDMMTVYLDSRVTGGRSGTTETGEHHLAVTAERNDVKLVSIVLGSLSTLSESGKSVVTFGSFLETSALLDKGFEGHRPVQLFYPNQALKQFEVVNGDAYVSTGILVPVQVLLPYGVTYDELAYRFSEDAQNIQAPVKAGDKISTVYVWYNNVCLAQADLYAFHDVNEKQITQTEQIREDTASRPGAILIAVGVILGLLLILLFGRRVLLRAIHRHRMKKLRRNRRRSR